MYFFSNTYIQINNNTKIKIKTFTDMAPRGFTFFVPLLCCHFETKSLVSELLSKLESV